MSLRIRLLKWRLNRLNKKIEKLNYKSDNVALELGYLHSIEDGEDPWGDWEDYE